MKKLYTLSIFTENRHGLLHRVTVIFTRRRINIESLTVSESETKGVHRYTIVIESDENHIQKIVKQLEKQVDVIKAFYHKDEETVFQEIALYKVPTHKIANGVKLETLVRNNHARILEVEPDFMIIEKTGHKEETQQLLDALAPFGVMEFVRSGRVSVTKPEKELAAYLQ